MKKVIYLVLFICAFTNLSKAQNVLALNKVGTADQDEEYVILSPVGKVIKVLSGVDIKIHAENLICAYEDKTRKMGYISMETGEWAIKPQFENVYNQHNFSEGLVVVEKEFEKGVTKSAIYDKTGKLILPFCDWIISDYSDGLAVVEAAGYQFGAIDRTGKLVIPFSQGKLNDFNNGLAIKGNNKEYVDAYADETGLWGFMDKTGKMVIKQEWSWAAPFSEGLAVVQNKQKKWGYLNAQGKLVIPCTYENEVSFSEGLAAVTIATGKADETIMAYIDKTGKQLAKPAYDVLRDFKEGMSAVVKIEKPGTDDEIYKFGFVDKNFKLVIPIIHEKAVDIGYYLPYFSFTDGLCPTTKGYIDKTGKLVINFPDASFISPEPFSNGFAFVKVFYTESAYLLMIDTKGKTLWKSKPIKIMAG